MNFFFRVIWLGWNHKLYVWIYQTTLAKHNIIITVLCLVPCGSDKYIIVFIIWAYSLLWHKRTLITNSHKLSCYITTCDDHIINETCNYFWTNHNLVNLIKIPFTKYFGQWWNSICDEIHLLKGYCRGSVAIFIVISLNSIS